MTVKTITPAEVYRLQQESGALSIIDVRESDEFAELSSPLAINHPLSSFDAHDLAKKFDQNTAIFFLCRSGNRSMSAATMLARLGFKSVYNIQGGMIAWAASGLPTVRT